MPRSRLSPTAFSCNAALKALQKGAQWQMALVLLLCKMPNLRQAPDEISFSATISACEKGGQWQLALHLLSEMPEAQAIPNTITYNAAMSACEKAGKWQFALALLDDMPERKVRADEISYNAAISACDGEWQLALHLLSTIPRARLRPDVISCSATISAFEKAGQWQLALRLLSDMPLLGVVPDRICYNAAISAFEKGGKWQLALGILLLVFLEPNEITYNAAISACEKGAHWQLAVLLLRRMPETRANPDEISYKASISACDRCWQEDHGLELLWEMQELGKAASASTIPWALARLGVSDRVAVDAAFEEALSRLRVSSCHPPEELASLAWASAVLGVKSAEFSEALARQALQRMRDFSVDELLLVAWGTAAFGLDAELSSELQNEVTARLDKFDVRNCPESVWKSFVEATLGVVWACNFAGVLSNLLLMSVRRVMRQIGRALDATKGAGTPPRGILVQENAWNALSQSEPQVLLDLCDRLVVLKPPNWEVAGSTAELQLLSYLKMLLGSSVPILCDVERGHGFLHRLDVPSSGLILAAKTYEAYYDLQVQLSAGEIARDYVVLCHGWVPPTRSSIDARTRLKVKTRAGGQGKPARTQLKVLAHATHEADSFSLLAIRIATGRRHQIRSHCSHIGHPTVSDGKYTAPPTFESDLSLCGRNFLHRYRLAFNDATGECREVLAAIPEDLGEALRQMKGKNTGSAGAVQFWLSGVGLRDWADSERLKNQWDC
ncbi:unnamed protein product [Polarella glacialis]|uniref:Pseudouridine synthase RsuA/RluA-like domain-containing protein n=1 Tax=Polarella glacialis TaxID=89957 RepID=A0A813GG87_POLGL|nr:unnamed protein product [Polarella glacialis]